MVILIEGILSLLNLFDQRNLTLSNSRVFPTQIARCIPGNIPDVQTAIFRYDFCEVNTFANHVFNVYVSFHLHYQKQYWIS